jgi:hypothetical protein
MRNKRISKAVAVSAVAGAVASAALSAGPAQATGTAVTAVDLPIAHYSHMVVDAVHQHVFISGGAGYDTVLVTDFSGRTVATIGGEPGATGLALSPDGGTVYAALAEGDAVSAISTDGLAETARYSTGAGTEPTYVAAVGGKVWFGYGGAAQGGIGSIDTGASPAAVTLGAAAGSWYAAPMLAANPDGELVAGEPGQSPDQLASYDVSGGTATVLAAEQFVYSAGNMGDLQISPDGTDVVVASGAPYYQQVFKVADLSAAGQYSSTNYPDSVSIAADGTVLAGVDNGGDCVYVFAPGEAGSVKEFGLPSGTLATAGLAVTPDGSELFAITGGAYGDDPVLNIVPDPEQATAGLTVSGPAQVKRRTAVTLTGALSGAAAYTGGQTLHVTRTDAADPSGVGLPDVTTAADGSFSVTDTPPGKGAVTYRVSYAGGVHLAPADATAAVQVGR